MSIKLKLQVKQEDIDNGIKGDECWCPIALAVERIWREQNINYHTIAVDGNITIYYDRGYWQLRNNDERYSEIDSFIEDFDSGKTVYPFELEIELNNEEY